MATPGVDCHRVKIPESKHGPGICLAGGTDVAPLGISYDYNVRSGFLDVGYCLLKGNKAGHAHSFVKGQVWLIGATQIPGGIYDGPVKLEGIIHRHLSRVHVQSDADQTPIGLAGPLQAAQEGIHLRYSCTRNGTGPDW